jgi:hypothetical protein
MVDARPARDHLRRLSRQGVGTRAVSAASDVNRTTLGKIMRGERQQVRKSTLERILAVDMDAASDHACIPAGETRAILRELAPEYLTKKRLAEALGYRSYGIPSRDRISVRNAHRIRKLHERVTA